MDSDNGRGIRICLLSEIDEYVQLNEPFQFSIDIPNFQLELSEILPYDNDLISVCISNTSGVVDGNEYNNVRSVVKASQFKEMFEHAQSDPTSSDQQLYLSQGLIYSKDENEEDTSSNPFSYLLNKLEEPMSQLGLKTMDEDLDSINLWISTFPTISSTHFDEHPNFLHVTKGSKTVKLWHSSNSQSSINPYPISSSACHFSTNTTCQFPNLTSELNQGDCLFIPEGWWHQVI